MRHAAAVRPITYKRRRGTRSMTQLLRSDGCRGIWALQRSIREGAKPYRNVGAGRRSGWRSLGEKPGFSEKPGFLLRSGRSLLAAPLDHRPQFFFRRGPRDELDAIAGKGQGSMESFVRQAAELG